MIDYLKFTLWFQFIVSSALSTQNHNHKLLSEEWYFDRRVSTPILSIVFILPLLMLKNIGSLSYTRLVAL